MCSATDTPPYDIVRSQRNEHSSAAERAFGIPPRPGWVERHWDGLRHARARRGRVYGDMEPRG